MRFVLLCAAVLALAGCGSSSSGTSSAPTATSPQQIAACLKKQGVNPPQQRRGPGPGGAGGGFLFGGGPQGATRSGDFSKMRAALKKCGINPGQGQRRIRVQSSPQFKQALTKFVTCVRKNGYDMPDPNLSGNGPVFDSSKVNRNDPKFKKAATKCQSDLQALRPQQGAPPAN
jgi:hypothetical protein